MGAKLSALPSPTDFIRVNPFEKYRDDLDQHKGDDVYLGHTLFWQNCDQIPTKNIYHTSNVEYRNLKLMVLEMIYYIMMLAALTAFAISSTSGVEHEQREQQLNFWNICSRVPGERLPHCTLPTNDADGFYQYMRETFTPTIFGDTEVFPNMTSVDFLYDLDENSQTWRPRYLGDTETIVLLGVVRVRQVRILPNRGCTVPENLTEVHPRCYSRFTEERQSRKFYAKRRIPKYIQNSYVWQQRNVTEMIPITGTYGSYPGDGFMCDLPLNRTLMKEMFRDLHEWGWVDVQTRALVVEVNVFNPNVNIIIANRLLFEFSPTGKLLPTHQVFVLPTKYLDMRTSGPESVFFTLQALLAITQLCFLGYHGFLIRKGLGQYFAYTWNLVDLVNLVLFAYYMYYRALIIHRYGRDNNLQPELAGLPLVYMPYVQLQDAYYSAQAVLSWLCLFSWMRLMKYLSLSKTFRVLIRTLEASCFQLFIFSFLYLSVTLGFAIAFTVGFGAADTTDGLYATFEGCFFTLFFMVVGGVDLSPILGPDSVAAMSNGPLRYMLFITYLVVLYLLFFNFFMAIVIDTYSRVSIQLSSFTAEAQRKKNPCMVFLYTYYYKWRGTQLVTEDEEDMGSSDEQYIEVSALPHFLADVWKSKQAALTEMIAEAERMQEAAREANAKASMKPGAFMKGSNFFTGSKASKASKSSSGKALNSNFISRLQLQRLLDDSPEIQDILGAKRAIDVIRRFRADAGPDPYTEITRMQENVIIKLDHLEKIGLHLEFKEIESLKMVSNGLNDALTEVQNQWRYELTQLLESCSSISNHLIDLTDRMAACTEKHNEIARDIQVEPVI
jgi:hypothetical protein